MSIPETSLIQHNLFSHASMQARNRELFYYNLIFLLLPHVAPEIVQTACDTALEDTSIKRSYHEA